MNGEHPEPTYYPPAKKSNIGLIIAGVAIAGGAGAYLYYAYKNGLWPFTNGGTKNCGDYYNQTECANNDCNWCDGECQQMSCDYVQCYYPNHTVCAATPGGSPWGGSNIYQCQNVGGGYAWTLIEQGSPECSSPATHNACFQKTTDHTRMCLKTLGSGSDSCPTNAAPFGCPCTDTCEPGGGGCCDDIICRWKPSGQTLALNAPNFTYQPVITNEGQNFNNVAVYDMNDQVYPYTQGPMTFTILGGSMHFINGPLTGLADAHILAYYGGEWRKIWYYDYISVGGSGTVNVPQTVLPAAVCAEKLGFNMECILAGGIQIDSCSIAFRY